MLKSHISLQEIDINGIKTVQWLFNHSKSLMLVFYANGEQNAPWDSFEVKNLCLQCTIILYLRRNGFCGTLLFKDGKVDDAMDLKQFIYCKKKNCLKYLIQIKEIMYMSIRIRGVFVQ